jgi:hypothetical protein
LRQRGAATTESSELAFAVGQESRGYLANRRHSNALFGREVERDVSNLLAKNPEYRSFEHSLHTGGVTGSIPVAPTIFPAEKLSFLVRIRSPKENKSEFIGNNRSLCTSKGVQNPCTI